MLQIKARITSYWLIVLKFDLEELEVLKFQKFVKFLMRIWRSFFKPLFFLCWWNEKSYIKVWHFNAKKLQLVWWQLWNFSVVQMKFNRFLYLNEPPKRMFWYLVRPFDWGLSQIGHFQFSESILRANIQFKLPEKYFLIRIFN